jgi:hypothetical protein
MEHEDDWIDVLKPSLQRAADEAHGTAELVVVRSDKEAFERLANENWNLVIADISMKKPSSTPGMTLASECRRRGIPCIAVSGSAKPAMVDTLLSQHRAIRFFQKDTYFNDLQFVDEARNALLASLPKEGVFVSYAHVDRSWLEEVRQALTKHLVNLQPPAELSVWDDSAITPGKWEPQIRVAIAQAKVALLLVTPDFLESPFIKEKELPWIVWAAERQQIDLFWVAVRSADYRQSALRAWQAANDPNRPLETLDDDERARTLDSLCEAIRGRLRKR